MIRTVSDVLNPNQKTPAFADQYEDPRWLERSRAFLNRHPSCNSCRRNDVKLHVHHVNYERGKPLWTAEDRELVTLCEGCHKLIHEAIKQSRRTFSFCNAGHAAALAVETDKLIRKMGSARALLKIAGL